MIQFDLCNIFQMGRCNHQLVEIFFNMNLASDLWFGIGFDVIVALDSFETWDGIE